MRFVVEDSFNYKGYPCVCVFQKMGHRTGYVGVDKNHPWYQVDYATDGPDAINCHWGLTYSGWPYWTNKDDETYWYFGFDCSHYGDGNDYEMSRKYGMLSDNEYLIQKSIYEKYNSFEYNTIKDIEFVRDNCKFIANQLEIIKNGGTIKVVSDE